MGPLDGKWAVTVIGWFQPWKVLNVLGDVKVIDGDRGHNRFEYGDWGNFNITWNGRPGTSWDGSHAILDYDVEKNPDFIRRIMDKLVRVNEERYNGTFYYRVDSDKRCERLWRKVFEFRLDRVKE